MPIPLPATNFRHSSMSSMLNKILAVLKYESE